MRSDAILVFGIYSLSFEGLEAKLGAFPDVLGAFWNKPCHRTGAIANQRH